MKIAPSSAIILVIMFFFVHEAHSQNLPQMKYKILAADEANGKVHCIDLSDTTKTWSISYATRDMQLIGGGKLLLHSGTEFAEYDLSTRAQLKKVPAGNGIQTVFRMNASGETYVGVDGAQLKIIDTQGSTKKTINISSITTSIRLIRPTMKNTFFVGGGGSQASNLFEFDENGKKVWEVNAGGQPYQAVRLPNGNTVISTGYGAQIVIVNSSGQVLRKMPADPKAASLNYYKPNFFAGFQILKNGNIVVANWLGHAGSISNGMPLLEFDSTGVLVSYWNKIKIVGSLHGVLVLDGLDTDKMNSDINGILGDISQTKITSSGEKNSLLSVISSGNLSKRVFDIAGRLHSTGKINESEIAGVKIVNFGAKNSLSVQTYK